MFLRHTDHQLIRQAAASLTLILALAGLAITSYILTQPTTRQVLGIHITR